MFNLTSTPLVHLNKKPYPVAVGATVGGGSVVNGMYFMRASATDYDAWEELGNPGWGWKGLLPYFIKSTNFTPPTRQVARKFGYTWKPSIWGNKGPIHNTLPPFQWPAWPRFFSAWKELKGITYPVDGNDGTGVGVFYVTSSQDPTTQTRSSARTGYYDPVAHRPNLRLTTGTKVKRILFSGKTAIGIEMTGRENNITTTAFAGKEVILAAGPIFSPNILHLSGIGPAAMLEKACIPLIHDLPVGTNFQDHPVAFLNWNLTQNIFPNPSTPLTNTTFNTRARNQYTTSRRGPWVQAHGNTAALLPLQTITDPTIYTSILTALTTQNLTAHLPPSYPPTSLAGYTAQHALLHTHLQTNTTAISEIPFSASGFTALALQKPFSRGTVSLAPDASGDPLIDYNTWSNPVDATIMVEMLRFARKYFATETMAPLGPVEVTPGANVTRSEDILSAMRAGLVAPSFAHPCGTCAMMPEELGGVVSAELLVHGVKRLSVVDSSIMPMIPAAHLCATVYAVAEKAADLIKARHR